MTALPVVPVLSSEKAGELVEKKIPLPGVFRAPIRLDVVEFVHKNVSKNKI